MRGPPGRGGVVVAMNNWLSATIVKCDLPCPSDRKPCQYPCFRNSAGAHFCSSLLISQFVCFGNRVSSHDIVVHLWDQTDPAISIPSPVCWVTHFDNSHPFSISIMFSASSDLSACSTSEKGRLTKHIVRSSYFGKIARPTT